MEHANGTAKLCRLNDQNFQSLGHVDIVPTQGHSPADTSNPHGSVKSRLQASSIVTVSRPSPTASASLSGSPPPLRPTLPRKTSSCSFITTGAIIFTIIAAFSVLAYFGFRSPIPLVSILLHAVRNVSKHCVSVYFIALAALILQTALSMWFVITTVAT
ncbi:hypothetical protein BV22DRAFT_1040858 [Leucogyrophana mollusca]|uniref:Uncharacterized protein n=1 Tax=Leucogyrophana mollusca TaxID=85980 RepID=A0ACB8B147_9AGAM|nr:hypothetical protein BV22DRAFT_1040858 [Leucogyrophana mollusca]